MELSSVNSLKQFDMGLSSQPFSALKYHRWFHISTLLLVLATVSNSDQNLKNKVFVPSVY
jgi:hypothetical protein